MTEIESKPFQSERSGRILGCNGSISWVGTLRCRTPEWHVPYYCWFLNQFLDKTMASKVIRSHWRQQQLHRTLPRTQQQRRFEIHSCSQWWPWGWSKNVGTLLYDSSIVWKTWSSNHHKKCPQVSQECSGNLENPCIQPLHLRENVQASGWSICVTPESNRDRPTLTTESNEGVFDEL